jgi:O-antigen/teichoic acid export membrane protein
LGFLSNLFRAKTALNEFDCSAVSTSTGSRVIRNTLWNLVGLLAPLLAAVYAIPVLIREAGVDRFGVLALAWLVIGYFGLFDLGLGRALIKLVSEKIEAKRTGEIQELIWTTLFLMVLLGLLGGGLLLAFTDSLVLGVLNIPATLQSEALDAFRLLAWSVPIVIVTTGLRGILEAYQRFDLVNLMRAPMGVLIFVGPIAVLPFSNKLDAMVLVLLLLRVVFFFVHAAQCENVLGGLLRRPLISWHQVRPLLGLGGWMTVSNVVGPMMVYIDRLVIGSVLSVAAVAYYVTPYEVVTKLLVIPGALMGVLFPAFSADLSGDRTRALDLFQRAVKWIFLTMYPAVLLATVFASDALRLWLTEEFSLKGTSVLQWLAAGVLLNGLAQVPFTFIQSAGRPDLTAKLHLAELLFYFVVLWECINRWGITGAAAAWTLRGGIDTVALFLISGWLESELKGAIKRNALIVATGLAVLAIGASLPGGLSLRIAFGILSMACFSFLAWRFLLAPDERALMNKGLLRVFRNLP